MSNEILYTTALNESDDLIHVNKAVKDRDYYCPFCKGDLILKKSGKKGKGSKRPHFAHKNVTKNCTPESLLHYAFKKNLTNLLNSHLSEKKELIINWNCVACTGQNQANLLTKVTSAREEYNLSVCQPDIALLDSDDNVIAVIEIVVTHSPEEEAVQYYQENEIILVQINLSSDEDLSRIEEKINYPDIIDYCLSPRCLHAERYAIKRVVFAYIDKCNRCFAQRHRFKIEANCAFGIWQTLDFIDDEIELVKSKVKDVKVVTDKRTKETYPIGKCMSCRRLRSRRGRL